MSITAKGSEIYEKAPRKINARKNHGKLGKSAFPRSFHGDLILFVHIKALCPSPRRQINVLAGNRRRIVPGFRRVAVIRPVLAKRVDFAAAYGQNEQNTSPDSRFSAGPMNLFIFHGSHGRRTAKKALIDKLSSNIDLIDNRRVLDSLCPTPFGKSGA